MRLVSSYFGKMFKQGFSEATPNAHDGRYHVSAVGFHPEAMEHLLNITHIKTGAIPHDIDFAMLFHVAVIIDYYDMREAMACYTTRWIKKVRGGNRSRVPKEYGLLVMLWIFVSWVFGLEDTFGDMTAVVLTKSKGPIPSLGLPITEIIGKWSRPVQVISPTRIKQIGNSSARFLEENRRGPSQALRPFEGGQRRVLLRQ